MVVRRTRNNGARPDYGGVGGRATRKAATCRWDFCSADANADKGGETSGPSGDVHHGRRRVEQTLTAPADDRRPATRAHDRATMRLGFVGRGVALESQEASAGSD